MSDNITLKDLAQDVLTLLAGGGPVTLVPTRGTVLKQGYFSPRTKEQIMYDPCEACALGAFYIALRLRDIEDMDYSVYAEMAHRFGAEANALEEEFERRSKYELCELPCETLTRMCKEIIAR